MTTIDLASCFAAVPDRRRAEGRIYGRSRRDPVLDYRHPERRSVVSTNPCADPPEALRAHCGFPGRRAATSAIVHLSARIERRKSAEQSYMDEGVQLLELARNARRLFERQEPRENAACSILFYRTVFGNMEKWSRLSGNHPIYRRKQLLLQPARTRATRPISAKNEIWLPE